MRPKKHFIAAEIKEEGLVFASDSYNCKIAVDRLMDTSMADERPNHRFEISKGLASDKANQSPSNLAYGSLDNTVNCSPGELDQNSGVHLKARFSNSPPHKAVG